MDDYRIGLLLGQLSGLLAGWLFWKKGSAMSWCTYWNRDEEMMPNTMRGLRDEIAALKAQLADAERSGTGW